MYTSYRSIKKSEGVLASQHYSVNSSVLVNSEISHCMQLIDSIWMFHNIYESALRKQCHVFLEVFITCGDETACGRCTKD